MPSSRTPPASGASRELADEVDVSLGLVAKAKASLLDAEYVRDSPGGLALADPDGLLGRLARRRPPPPQAARLLLARLAPRDRASRRRCGPRPRRPRGADRVLGRGARGPPRPLHPCRRPRRGRGAEGGRRARGSSTRRDRRQRPPPRALRRRRVLRGWQPRRRPSCPPHPARPRPRAEEKGRGEDGRGPPPPPRPRAPPGPTSTDEDDRSRLPLPRRRGHAPRAPRAGGACSASTATTSSWSAAGSPSSSPRAPATSAPPTSTSRSTTSPSAETGYARPPRPLGERGRTGTDPDPARQFVFYRDVTLADGGHARPRGRRARTSLAGPSTGGHRPQTAARRPSRARAPRKARGADLAFQRDLSVEVSLDGALPRRPPGPRPHPRPPVPSRSSSPRPPRSPLRDKPKDGYDVWFLLRHHPAGLDGLAAGRRRTRDSRPRPRGPRPPRRRLRFPSITHGPVDVARFRGFEPASVEYDQARQDAFQRVSALLESVGRERG